MKCIKTSKVYDVLVKKNTIRQSLYCSLNNIYLFDVYLFETKLTHQADYFTFLQSHAHSLKIDMGW